MAVALQQKPLTYEDYLAEGEVEGRYEIIDGVRYFMTGTSPDHGDISANIWDAFRAYQKATKRVRAYQSTVDVIISRKPLRTRQPDLFMISIERAASIGWPRSMSSLTLPPELAVEVLSPSDSRTVIAAKLADFAMLGIDECWLVAQTGATVEQLRLDHGAYRRVALLGLGDTITSVAFPDLSLVIDNIFDLG